MHHREVQSFKDVGVTVLLQRIKPEPLLLFRNASQQKFNPYPLIVALRNY